MQGFYDRLGNIIRDRLDSDEDPFDTWDENSGKNRQAGNTTERKTPPRKSSGQIRIRVPDALMEDFRNLGVLPGVSLETCKAAWKKLLKEYHPDTNRKKPSELFQYTQISIKITNSYQKIFHWYKTGMLM